MAPDRVKSVPRCGGIPKARASSATSITAAIPAAQGRDQSDSLGLVAGRTRRTTDDLCGTIAQARYQQKKGAGDRGQDAARHFTNPRSKTGQED
jgi:hypothetical protein